MKLFGHEIEGIPRILVILVAILLVASGLCGLQLAILNADSRGSNQLVAALSSVFMFTGLAELAAMVLSALGIVVMLVVWVIKAVMD